MDIFESINSAVKLTENEKVMVKYMLANKDTITQLSSREFARKTYTNATSILRFIKKLGFSDYNDFRVHILSYIKSYTIRDTTIISNEDILSLLTKASAMQIGVIEQTKDQIPLDTMKKIIEIVKEKTYIDIIANDANASIADYASYLLVSLGRMVTVYRDKHMQMNMGININEEHVVFIISKYGKDNYILNTLQVLKSRNIQTIAITADASNTLAKKCDHVLLGALGSSSDPLKDKLFHISSKFIFDALYIILFSHNYENTLQLDKLQHELLFKKS